MRGRWAAACLGAGLSVAGGIGPADAQSGNFFKNMFGGGGGGPEAAAPSLSAPKAMDPEEAYCPTIDVGDGGAALQAFAGSAGDSGRLRHQITFGRLSRECAMRPGGAVGVKVGVQIRALLGPAGSAGTFDAPLTVSVKYNGAVLDSRTRRVAIPVPAGTAQGEASVIVSDLVVPADKAVGYDIEVSLSGSAKAPKTVSNPSPSTASNAAPKVAKAHPRPAKPDAKPATATAAAAPPAAASGSPVSLFDQSPEDPE